MILAVHMEQQDGSNLNFRYLSFKLKFLKNIQPSIDKEQLREKNKKKFPQKWFDNL